MPKDNVTPHNVKEPHTWKCTKCGEKGTAATKRDAQLAKALHVAMMH